MFEFIPDYTQAGSDTVRFIASDGIAADTQLVDITVNNTNLAPVLDTVPSPQIVVEGSLLQVTVTSSDPDGTIPVLTAENLPPHAVFADSGNGAGLFEFAPDYNQAGAYQVLFIAADGDLADSQYVDIDVSNTDRAPELDPITPPTVIEGDHLDLRVTATDPDGDIITLIAEFTSANMAFADSSGGVGGLTFDPDYTQAGVHPVRFIAQSNALADTQLVDITVTNVDLPPELASISPQSVAEGDHLDLRVTATDPDGDVISLTAEFTSANMAFVDSTGGVGGLTFDPDYAQAGVHQVRFIAQSNTLADTQLVDITVTEVDLPPVLTDIPPQSVPEGGHLEFQVTATDPDGDSIELTAGLLVANMAFVDSTGGVGGFTFDPDSTQADFYQVRFIASSNALADTQLVDITVGNVDLPPSIDPIAPPAVAEGDHLDLRVTAYDPDGDTITLTAEFTSSNMAFVDSTGGIGGLTFDPDYAQAGVHQVRFIATSNALADTQLVDITVTNVNLPPVLDSIATPQSVPEGDSLLFTVTATDPDGVPSLVADSLPANATFMDKGDGTGDFRFLPDYSQSGLYAILFYATDGEAADSQYVDVTVNHINLAPELDPIGPQAVDEGGSLILDIAASDFDGTIPVLTALDVPPNASFVDNNDGTGVFGFDPDYFQDSLYYVTFIASDGVLADSETVEITVNDTPRSPIIDPINDRSIFEGQTVSIIVNATDPDLTIPALSAINIPVNASFTDSLNGRGFFTFSPDYTQSGTYVVTFIASDGVLADSEVVNVFVFDVGNLPPVIDPIPPQTVIEGEHLEFVVSASDPDGTTPALQGLNLPPNASFADSGNGNGLFVFDPDFTQAGMDSVLFRAFDGELYDSLWVEITVIDFGFPPEIDSIGPQTVTEGEILQILVSASDPDGTIPQLSVEQLPVNAVFEDSLNGRGLLTFTPNYIQSGIDTVLFIATDGALSDSEYVEITVIEAGNQPPVLGDIGPRSVDEGDALSFAVSASDPDSTIPVLSAVNLPANASFVDNFDGTGWFDFYPDYTQAGVDTVLFIAADSSIADSEYVEITIYDINLPPELALIDPQTVNEGEILQLIVTATDPDGTIPSLFADSLPVNASFVDSSNGTGLLEFMPDYTQAGVYNVLFIAYDGLLTDSQYVEITVLDVNLRPVFDPVPDQQVVEGGSLFFTVRATDPEGLIPSLSVDFLLFNSTFTDSGDGTGLFEYSPSYTQSGVDTMIFIASDGVLEESLKVQITTIEAGNQPPVLDPIGSRIVNESQQLQFNVYGSDIDGPPPALDAIGLPVNSVFIDSSNGAGTFTFNPDYYQSGSYDVLFITTDGDLADSENVEIVVNNVNQPPVLSPISDTTIYEGDSLGINISAIDLDGDSISMTAEPLIANMTFVDSGNGSAFFQFMPDYTQSGIYNVTFAVTDSVDADTQFVQINVVEAGNQAPELAPIDSAYFITEGYVLDIPILGTDLDNDSLVLSADSLVENMTFEDYGDGTGLFNFSPSYVQSGDYSVTFRAFDGIEYDSATTFIHVAEEGNQPPVLDPIGPQTVPEGDSLVVDVSAIDPEGAIPYLYVSGNPDSSYFVDYGDGTGRFVFYPDFYDAGLDTVRFSAVDDGGFADYEDVLITITDVNLPPHITFTGDTTIPQGDTTIISILVTDSSDYQPGAIALSHGYLPLNSEFRVTGNGTGLLTFYPDFSQVGADSALIIATDSDDPPLSDMRWIYFDIYQTNRAPVFPPPSPGVVNEGATLVMDLSATDPDGDSIIMFINCDCPDPLPARSEFEDFGNGTARFTFYPDFTQSGIYVIYFAASDGDLTVTQPTLVQVVEMGNQIPTLNPIGPLSVVEGEILDVYITATDPDSTYGSFTLEGSIPWNLVFKDSSNNSSSIHFEPFYNQSGVYDMLVVFTDVGGAADSEYVDLTVVEAGNQPPQLGSLLDRQIAEGGIVEFLIHATDPDSTIPTLDVHNLPENASLSDSGNGTGYFVFTPSYFQSGVYPITFLAIDSENPAIADSTIVTITVTDVNRVPVIEPVGPFTLNEGETLIFDVISRDPDSTTPNLVALLPPRNSTFITHGDGTGTFTFIPDYFQAGLDTAKFLAIDSLDPTLFVTHIVELEVLDVNRAPVLDPIADTIIGDGFLLSIPVISFDPDSTIPSLFQRNVPDSAVFTDYGDGTGLFQWRPRFDDIGIYFITFGCTDQMDPSLADSQIVTIEVITSGNHPPIFDPVPDQVVNATETLDLLIIAIDPEADPITITYVDTLPTGMVFTDSGGGVASLFWVPTYDQGGDHIVTLVATDDSLLTDTLRVNITVRTYIRGDANGDGNLSGLDVIYLVSYFKGGPPPDPMEAGDANGDGMTNGLDVVYLVAYFKGIGPPPPPAAPPGGGYMGSKIGETGKFR
ncbi:MAG: hypothetical protein JSU85_13320 [Candidatus Zixiibacteriota bacterium]|nr:MAG: hypothetical protein JSU85_13320 [candidate division Zixibacteria bacterium]